MKGQMYSYFKHVYHIWGGGEPNQKTACRHIKVRIYGNLTVSCNHWNMGKQRHEFIL